jgi:flagellar protein FlgJ
MSYGAINGSSSFAQTLAADTQSLGNLKLAAGTNSPSAIKETAKQFESLFMRELIKSMRDATVKSGMLDNAGSDLGTDLLDQQFSVQMSGQPGGLSDLIAAQLTRQAGPATPPASTTSTSTGTVSSNVPSNLPISAASSHTKGTHHTPTAAQVDFVSQHSAVAGKVEQLSGIPANFMLGQAAHETGWGKHEIKLKGGAPSYNLFGMKAGASWTGKVAEVTTTEYQNGVATKKVARFRAYNSYEDSFKDYARMINESPRYAQAKLQTGSATAFASGLQKAGYATDPDYANKLSRAINTTLQLRRVQA